MSETKKVRVSLDRDMNIAKGLEKKTIDFIRKLTDNPTSNSLRIKPLNNAVDRRVRTGRVTDQYRAVLFELEGSEERHFLLIAVGNHDEMNDYAARLRINTNPSAGTIEVVEDTAQVDPAALEAEINSRAERLVAERLAEAQALKANAVGSEGAGIDIEQGHVAAEIPRETLAKNGISAAELGEAFNLSASTVALLNNSNSEEALLEGLERQPQWEQDIALSAASGMTIDEIVQDRDIDQQDDTDDALIQRLHYSSGFLTGDNDELKAAIESGSFAEWRVFLHPSQRTAVTGSHKGSARIVGSAGTGKTVVLLHRAKYLLDTEPESARIFLTTFNKALSNQLKAQMSILDPTFKEASVPGAAGLWISGIDAQVSRFIKNANKEEIEHSLRDALGIETYFAPQALGDTEAAEIWREAAEINGNGLDTDVLQPIFLEDEYRDVVLTNSITTKKDYLRVPRPGRSKPLNRDERKKVWDVIESFVRKCALRKRLTFPAMAVLGAHILETRDRPFFDHVLVDEAQDFHAGHWRFIRASVAKSANDIFIAEDSHQRIYGHRLVLSRYGIETRGRASKRLRLNYRTTAQTLAYASAILEGAEWVDSEEQIDELTGYRSIRQGQAPLIIRADTAAKEHASIVRIVKHWTETYTNRENLHIGVLVRNRSGVKTVTDQLSDNGVIVSTDRSGLSSVEAQVSVMTMHNAKGMEFSHVIIAEVNERAVPRRTTYANYPTAEKEEALQRERALLYVAASRARDQLVVTLSGKPSELLPSTA